MIRHKDLLKSGGTSTIEDFPKEDRAILVKVLSVIYHCFFSELFLHDRFIDSGGIRNYACAYHLCLPSLKRGKLLGYAGIA